jgi:hypothetical protein
MRAFVRLSTQRDIVRKLEDLEKKYLSHDVQFKTVFKVLKQLIQAPATAPVERPKRPIGFRIPSQR